MLHIIRCPLGHVVPASGSVEVIAVWMIIRGVDQGATTSRVPIVSFVAVRRLQDARLSAARYGAACVSVHGDGVVFEGVDAFNDVDFALADYQSLLYVHSLLEAWAVRLAVYGHIGPKSQYAGQVPQPQGIWARSRTNRPWV